MQAAPLAPYAATESRSRGRRYSEPDAVYRGQYQRDRDRIIHSTAFRRLVYKTQVFVNHEGDYYRTRLFKHLSTVALSTLGYREDLPEKEVRRRLRSGEMTVDEDVLAAIKQGWPKPIEAQKPASSSRPAESVGDDPQVETIVAFLGAELEINDES